VAATALAEAPLVIATPATGRTKHVLLAQTLAVDGVARLAATAVAVTELAVLGH